MRRITQFMSVVGVIIAFVMGLSGALFMLDGIISTGTMVGLTGAILFVLAFGLGLFCGSVYVAMNYLKLMTKYDRRVDATESGLKVVEGEIEKEPPRAPRKVVGGVVIEE